MKNYLKGKKRGVLYIHTKSAIKIVGIISIFIFGFVLFHLPKINSIQALDNSPGIYNTK